jgi:hypothetical protein
MFELPLSIDSATFETRNLYISYPPGCVLPIFLISKLLNIEPNAHILMSYNLFNQLACSLILTLMSFKLTRITWLAILTGSAYLLWPSTLYWQQNVFFSDQAIILPFLIVWYCEFSENKWAKKLQLFFIFYGALTDWFFVSVVSIIVIFRFFNFKYDFKKTFKSILPILIIVAIAALLFLAQIYSLNGFSKIYQKFLDRTAISTEGSEKAGVFWKQFWLGYLSKQFGYIALLFFVGGFITVFTFFKKNQIFQVIGFIACSILLHSFLLRNHTAVHDFSALKFASFISLIPILYPFFKENWKRPILFFVSFLFIANLALSHWRWHKMFVMNYSNYYPEKILVKEHTEFQDMVFNPHISESTQPWRSMKVLKQVNDFHQIQPISGARINLLIIRRPHCQDFFDKFSEYANKESITFFTNSRQSRLYQFSIQDLEKMKLTFSADQKFCQYLTDEIF